MKNSISSAIHYTDNFKYKNKTNNKLFRALFLITFLIFPLILALLWLVYLWGEMVAITVSITSFIAFLILMPLNKYLQVYLLILPVIMLNLIWGSKAAAATTMMSTLLVIIIVKWLPLRKDYLKKIDKRISYKYFNKYKLLAKSINLKIFDKKIQYTNQTIVIFLLISFYIVGPLTFEILPPDIAFHKIFYKEFVNQTYTYIPYFTLLIYTGLTLQNSIDYLIKPLLIKDGNYFLKETVNFSIILLFSVAVLFSLVIPILIIGSTVILILNTVAQIELVIVVGFFMFPRFITQIASYLLAFIIQFYPTKLLVTV